MVDKIFAMSSFLQFRAVFGKVRFSDKIGYPNIKDSSSISEDKTNIKSSRELHDYLKQYVSAITSDGKTALALSGGIDSAILAKLMPKGSVAYTFKCIVPGVQVVDESIRAKDICRENNLEHRIVEVYWEDYCSTDHHCLIRPLMQNKNAPIHSIEVQIYKAACQAKRDGFERLLFAEGADAKFGGLDSLLSKDFTIGEFIDRYSFVMPYRVLKQFHMVTEPFQDFVNNGFIEVHNFLQQQFEWEYKNSYFNACETANIEFASPYCYLEHHPLNITRIRSGDSKYLVREVYNTLYPNTPANPKIPMPRPMDEWFENWGGPKRPEFWENCHVNMTGDQKYYIWILERFLEDMGI